MKLIDQTNQWRQSLQRKKNVLLKIMLWASCPLSLEPNSVSCILVCLDFIFSFIFSLNMNFNFLL